MRQGAPVRCAEPAEARTMQSPPPFPPAGGAGGGRGAQRVVALRGVFGHEGQGGSDEGPLLVAHIAGIGLTCHTEIIPRVSLKCITGSRSLYVHCGRIANTAHNNKWWIADAARQFVVLAVEMSGLDRKVVEHLLPDFVSTKPQILLPELNRLLPL